MIIKLNMTSEIPIYVQLRNEIVLGIGRGELKAGEQLPTGTPDGGGYRSKYDDGK